MAKQDNIGKKFENLIAIMAKLRSPDGCPWDREQTHASLRQYLLEEAYEVIEALDVGDQPALKEELGDLLLQIVFHAQISSEDNGFDVADVIDAISEKLIRRHPNVFGDVEITSAAEQSINWEKIKKSEGKESVLDGVPVALSALLRAYRLQQKASTVGFDWPETTPVWDKIEEELAELKQACQQKEQRRIDEEMGDLLFSLVNLSRFLSVNPEDALRNTIAKFNTRFRKVEREFADRNQSMADATLEELDAVWEKVKRDEPPIDPKNSKVGKT